MTFYFNKSKYILFLLLLLTTNFVYSQTFSLHPQFLQVGPNPCSIAIADLNGDGIPDIVTADRGEMRNPREEKPANDELSILLSQGILNYLKLHPSLKTDFAPYAIAIANMDSLKWPDIVVANFLAKKNQDIQIFHNLKEENVFTITSIKIPDDNLKYSRLLDGDEQPLFTIPGLTSLVITDLNKDGLKDVITTGWSSDIVAILLGDSKESLVLHQIIPTPGGPRSIAITDFDNDKLTDIAVTMFNSGEILFLKGNEEYKFVEHSRILTRGIQPNRIFLSDFNADGKTDIVISHKKINQPLEILYGDTIPFSFRLSETDNFNTTNPEVNTEIMDITVSDFNNDHLPDIAMVDRKGQQLIVMINKGSNPKTNTTQPTLFTIEKYPIKSGKPVSINSADLNQDNFVDIIIGTQDANEVLFFLNNKKK